MAPIAARSATLAELERTFTVMAGADAAFDFLSDPIRLPEYVSPLRLEDSTAVEGELDVDADLTDRDGAPDAGFIADRKTRHMEWGRPGSPYGGSIDVAVGTTSTSAITIRLRTRDDADEAAVSRVVDEAVSSIRRLLLLRR
ncbi:MAG: hypothetical protein H0U52_02855 [Chloroflexi bacterium]|nr:hypothetical protein [Chloroflexota bacterium]